MSDFEAAADRFFDKPENHWITPRRIFAAGYHARDPEVDSLKRTAKEMCDKMVEMSMDNNRLLEQVAELKAEIHEQ